MNTQTELDEARRRALLAGGAMFAGSLVGTAGEAVAQDNQPEQIGAPPPFSALPVRQIERILRAQGTVKNGVLTVNIDRNELNVTGPNGVPFKAPFEGCARRSVGRRPRYAVAYAQASKPSSFIAAFSVLAAFA